PITDFTRKMGVSYTILKGNSKVGDLYGGVDRLPLTYAVDRSGKVVHEIVGLVSESEIESAIKEALGSGQERGLGFRPIIKELCTELRVPECTEGSRGRRSFCWLSRDCCRPGPAAFRMEENQAPRPTTKTRTTPSRKLTLLRLYRRCRRRLE